MSEIQTKGNSTAATEIKQQIDLKNSVAVISYGANAQKKTSEFVDSILHSNKTKEFGESGDMLSSLVVAIKSFDADAASKDGFFAKLFGGAKNKLDRLKSSYTSAEGNIDKIVKNLEQHRRTLMDSSNNLDKLYTGNVEYLAELENYIVAGEEKIAEVSQTDIPALKAKAEETNDQMDIQNYRDMMEALDRFEKKVHDLKLTKTVSMQMLPQIRLQQANNNILVDKIHSSIVNSIPLWKSQMVLALGLSQTKSALEAQRTITDATNEMLKKNSEMLKTATIETARESERSIIDIETIKKANSDIVSTIQQVSTIQLEAKAKRAAAEEEIERLGNELKENVFKALNSR